MQKKTLLIFLAMYVMTCISGCSIQLRQKIDNTINISKNCNGYVEYVCGEYGCEDMCIVSSILK